MIKTNVRKLIAWIIVTLTLGSLAALVGWNFALVAVDMYDQYGLSYVLSIPCGVGAFLWAVRELS